MLLLLMMVPKASPISLSETLTSCEASTPGILRSPTASSGMMTSKPSSSACRAVVETQTWAWSQLVSYLSYV